MRMHPYTNHYGVFYSNLVNLSGKKYNKEILPAMVFQLFPFYFQKLWSELWDLFFSMK